MGLFDSISSGLSSAFNAAPSVATNLLNAVSQSASSVGQYIADSGVGQVASTVGGYVADTATKAATSVGNAVQDVKSYVTSPAAPSVPAPAQPKISPAVLAIGGAVALVVLLALTSKKKG